MLNSDAKEYGGSGNGNAGGVNADPQPTHGRPYSISLTIPPLSVSFFKNVAPPLPATAPVALPTVQTSSPGK